MKKILTSAMALMMVLSLAACGSQTEEEVEEAEETEEIAEEEEADPLTEEDLDGIVEGVEDHFVLQDAKDVDYMSGVSYDKTVEMTEADEKKASNKVDDAKDVKSAKKTKVIHSVTVDDSKVDASTPGTYKVTYTVKVNRPAYDEYVAQKAEEKDEVAKADEAAEETKADEAKDDAETTDEAEEDKTDNETEPEDEDVDETDLEDVIIGRDIEIVDEEKAKELVEEGETVWTDESKDYGETLEEEKKSSESTPNTGSDDKTDAASDDASKSDDSSSKDSGGSSSGSSGSSNSGNSSSSASSSGSSKSTSCDHNWVATTHEATGHYEKVLVSAAYDEKVENGDAYVCNNCGYSTQSSTEIGLHCKPGKCTEKGTSYSVKTQYTTVHHDAVYENKWVQDSAAYTTYKCSKCGATK